MLRTRFSLLAFGAAGLGFLSGCMNLSDHSWFGRRNNRACCDLVSMPCCDTGMSSGPIIVAPPVGGTIIPAPTPIPQTTMPPLAQPPANGRLVPQPQSQPMPYTPPGQTTRFRYQ